jgi:hypothetical protein
MDANARQLCLPKIPSQWRKHRINNIQVQRVACPTEHVTLLHKRPRGHFLQDGVFGRHNPPFIQLGGNIFGAIVFVSLIGLLGPYLSTWIPVTVPEYVENFCEQKKQAGADIAVRLKRN